MRSAIVRTLLSTWGWENYAKKRERTRIESRFSVGFYSSSWWQIFQSRSLCETSCVSCGAGSRLAVLIALSLSLSNFVGSSARIGMATTSWNNILVLEFGLRDHWSGVALLILQLGCLIHSILWNKFTVHEQEIPAGTCWNISWNGREKRERER